MISFFVKMGLLHPQLSTEPGTREPRQDDNLAGALLQQDDKELGFITQVKFSPSLFILQSQAGELVHLATDRRTRNLCTASGVASPKYFYKGDHYNG